MSSTFFMTVFVCHLMAPYKVSEGIVYVHVSISLSICLPQLIFYFDLSSSLRNVIVKRYFGD